MRFMVIVKANKDSEAGIMPSRDLLEKMGAYNEDLAKAGILLAADGLHPSSKSARVKFLNGEHVVTEGPFPETEQLIAGFWIWRVKSKEEAIEWLKRAPFGGGVEIELRQVFETADFGDQLTPELREQEARVAAQAKQRSQAAKS